MINLSLSDIVFGLISPFPNRAADSDKDNLNSYEITFPNFSQDKRQKTKDKRQKTKDKRQRDKETKDKETKKLKDKKTLIGIF